MAIRWDESRPVDSDQFAGFAAETRSLKSALAIGLAETLQWPGSGGGSAASAGSVNPGTARLYYDVQSNLSVPTRAWIGWQGSAASGAGAFVASDTSRLFSATVSNDTRFLGSARLLETANVPPSQTVRTEIVKVQTSVADVAGSFGFPDFPLGLSEGTLVVVNLGGVFPGGYAKPPDIFGSLNVDVTLGKKAVQGMICSLLTSDPATSTATFRLHVIARKDIFPTGDSACVATLNVWSRYTNELGY